MNKYKLSEETYNILDQSFFVHQIEALVDIQCYGVKAGDKGGYVEGEHNLDQHGNCWLENGAIVIGNARVYSDAILKVEDGRAPVLCGHATVGGSAELSGLCLLSDNALVLGSPKIKNSAMSGNTLIIGNIIADRLFMENSAQINAIGKGYFYSYTTFGDNARIYAENDFLHFTLPVVRAIGSKEYTEAFITTYITRDSGYVKLCIKIVETEPELQTYTFYTLDDLIERIPIQFRSEQNISDTLLLVERFFSLNA